MGTMADLEEAIRLAPETIDATPQDHPKRATYSNNLGFHLRDGYSRTGAMADLGESIRVVTYIPKSMSDRANQFPRQLPPATTNFLAAPVQPQFTYQKVPVEVQPQTQPQQLPLAVQYHGASNTPYRGPVVTAPPQNFPYQPYQPPQQEQQQQYHQPQAHLQPQQNQWQGEPLRRSSRSHSRSSHERGRSAPPPFNSSPWDVNPGSSTSQREPQIWKALPATPAQYRLGEDGMPWSSWSFPMGYDDNDDDGGNDDQGDSRRHPRDDSPPTTWGSEYFAESSRRAKFDDRSRGRAQEMQALATALLTVDNGFEDQWWYQGPRLVNVAGALLVPTAVPNASAQPVTVSWAVAQEDQETFQPSSASFQPTSPRSSVVDIVSSMSDYPSPMSSFGGLGRSLTTRSDELHM